LGLKIGIICLGVVAVIVLWVERIVLGVLGRKMVEVMGREVDRWLRKWVEMRERMKSITLLPV
jgi:hypothetical protein